MVGREINTQYYREDRQRPFDPGLVLVQASGLGLPGHYEDISFTLHAGEVLAIVGTEGSGREEVMRSVFGLERPTSGRLTVSGEEVTEYSPAGGVRRGLGYIPRERKIESIVAGLNVFENMTLCQLGAYNSRGFLRIPQEHAWRQIGSRSSRSRRPPNLPIVETCQAVTSRRLCSPSGAARVRT